MKFYHKAQVHVSESKTFVQSKIIPAVQIGRERERERESTGGGVGNQRLG